MSAHSLIEHFHLLAAAPGGVPKLRELILNLAVRGKLVPQDPNDEPAAELLKRIQAEKARLVAEGKIRKDKPLPEVGEDETPYELPQGWRWSRIADISRDWGQKTPDKAFSYIDVSAINNAKGIIEAPSIVMPADAPSRARKVVEVGTVIYSTVRPYLLNIAVIDREFDPEPIASTAFAIVHPLGGITSQYLFWYLRSPCFKVYVESVQTGIAYPAINDGQFFSGLIPIPPLAEQSRIVAKVDELMALCDQLEAQQGHQTEGHARLVSTLLETLTQSADAAAFADNWARLAEHFDWLFDTPEAIDQLKQTILQLAVMGKLVPQDPNDEPARELLKKIRAEKDRLIREGKIKKDKPLPEISEDEKPFDLPKGWKWVRASDVTSQVTDGTHHTPTYVSSGVPFLSVKDLSSGLINFSSTRFISEDEHTELKKRCNPERGDLLLTKVGTTGIAVKVDTDVAFSIFVSVALLKLAIKEIGEYLELLINSPFVRRQSEEGTEGVGNKNLVLRKISAFVFPLPPLSEQHRIVAKVDELMAVCDALSEKLTAARKLNQQLLDTLAERVA